MKVPKVLEPRNLLFYGVFSLLGFAITWGLTYVAGKIYGQQLNLTILQLVGLGALAAQAITVVRQGSRLRADNYYHTNTLVRGWVAEMKQLLSVNDAVDKVGEPEVKKILFLIDYLLVIFQSFENPDDSDFAALFDEQESKDEATLIIKQIIRNDGLTPKLEDVQRVRLLSQVRFQLTDLLHRFVTKHVPPGKQSIRTEQIDKLHGLIGKYDSNTKEKIKSPEWLFVLLVVCAILLSAFTQDTYEGKMFVMWVAGTLLGYETAMLIDYSAHPFWGRLANAIDFTDQPLKTARAWLKKDLE